MIVSSTFRGCSLSVKFQQKLKILTCKSTDLYTPIARDQTSLALENKESNEHISEINMEPVDSVITI